MVRRSRGPRGYGGMPKRTYYNTMLKKTAARRRRNILGLGGVNQPVQYFTRSAYTQAAITIPAGGAGAGYAYQFQLNQLPNFAEFQGLYDQYKISKVKFQLIPRFNFANSSGSGNVGSIFSVMDFDDATAPTSRDDLLQYQNLKRTKMTSTLTRTISPAVAVQIYTAPIPGFSPKRTFLDLGNAAVPHYGIKLWVDGSLAGTSPNPMIFDLQVKFWLSMKNVR